MYACMYVDKRAFKIVNACMYIWKHVQFMNVYIYLLIDLVLFLYEFTVGQYIQFINVV